MDPPTGSATATTTTTTEAAAGIDTQAPPRIPAAGKALNGAAATRPAEGGNSTDATGRNGSPTKRLLGDKEAMDEQAIDAEDKYQRR